MRMPNKRTTFDLSPTWTRTMDVEDSLTINKAYAAKYEAKKRAEELSKLRDKYGDVSLEASESSSSEEEEEDEDGEMLTADVEKEFLRTLSLIHSKDPRIYDKQTQFFRKDGENKEEKVKKKEKEEKPMFLKDYERKQLLERGVMAGVSDSEEEEEENIKKLPATYLEEQEQLKAEFHQAVAGEGEGEGESLLTIRKKGKEEMEEEERDYVQWLKGERERMERGEEDFSGLQSLWSAPDLDSGEAFLRDYILNRRFIDRDSTRSQVPSYEEIVGGDSDSSEGEEGEVDVSEDEDALNKQEEFERKYNFRFEEPGGDQISSYPRMVPESVRREDDRRKERRKARDERREKEKEQKQEELKRLKKLKRKEIKQKLDRIKRITGNPNVGFSALDLEGDFDPASYDQTMARAFDDDYYLMEEEEGAEDRGGEGGDEGKPVFSDDEEGEVYGDWDQWDPQQEPHCEDPDFNMDADYDPEMVAPPTKKSKLSRRRHKLARAITTHKPQFDPEEETFEEYFDEYYSLDYEDVIGDLPCRFKYKQVPANSFGLSVEEVLSCEDKELNQWVSLKKAVQIRTEEEEERDKRRYRKQARNFKKKYQILASLKESQEEEEESGRRRKPRKTKASKAADSEETREPVSIEGEEEEEEEMKVARRVEEAAEDSISATTGSSEGSKLKSKGTTGSSEGSKLKSKGKKKKRTEEAAGDSISAPSEGRKPKGKKKKVGEALANGVPTSTAADTDSTRGKKQKKKKRRPKVPSSATKKLSSARLKSYGL